MYRTINLTLLFAAEKLGTLMLFIIKFLNITRRADLVSSVSLQYYHSLRRLKHSNEFLASVTLH